MKRLQRGGRRPLAVSHINGSGFSITGYILCSGSWSAHRGAGQDNLRLRAGLSSVRMWPHWLSVFDWVHLLTPRRRSTIGLTGKLTSLLNPAAVVPAGRVLCHRRLPVCHPRWPTVVKTHFQLEVSTNSGAPPCHSIWPTPGQRLGVGRLGWQRTGHTRISVSLLIRSEPP
jgi:hypothetical protein